MEQAWLILVLISLVGFVSVISASTFQQQCEDAGAAEVKAGYWSPFSSRYSPFSTIDTSQYTHLYYSSLSIDDTSSTVAPPTTNESSLLASFSSSVKSGSPSVKTILSIGTNQYEVERSNAAFSKMAADKNLRTVFINSSIQLARANGFDGLDLSWIFPATQMDMENFGVLLEEWRATIIRESTMNSLYDPLLLTATLYFSNHIFDMPDSNLDYPIDDISSNLDWANILTFGFHGNSNTTSADAPLYDKSSHFSVSYGVISWLDAGIPPCKLVMGIPLFGRSWFLNSESTVVAYDNQSVAEYFYNGDLWVSFDSVQVVQKKLQFAARSQVLGYFLWIISFDDSNSTISKQASESWHQYAQGGLGTMHARAPNEYVASKSYSASLGTCISKTLSYLLSSVSLYMVLVH